MPNGKGNNKRVPCYGEQQVVYAVDYSDDGLLQVMVRGCEYGVLALVGSWMQPLFGGIAVDKEMRFYRQAGRFGYMTTLTFSPGGQMSVNDKDAVRLFEARLMAGLKRRYGERVPIKIKKMSVEKLVNL